MENNTLSVTDNRTGKKFELKIENGCIRAMDLRQMKVDAEDFGLNSSSPSQGIVLSSISFHINEPPVLDLANFRIDYQVEKAW